jgi:anti-sigma factor RsiW
MNRCNEAFDLQAYLDGDLDAAATLRLERHMDQCASCALELAVYRRVFASLDAMPLLDPGPMLSERILEKVVPSRVRRRWMQVAGWSYAATFVAFLGGAMLWLSQPGTQEALGSASSAASIRLTGVLVLALESLNFAARVLAGAWGFALATIDWFAPLARAFAPWLAHPSVRVALPAAALASAAVVWWMRSREASAREGPRHVAILGG